MHILLSSDTTVLISIVGIYKIWMVWNVTSTTNTSSFSSKEKKSGKNWTSVQWIFKYSSSVGTEA